MFFDILFFCFLRNKGKILLLLILVPGVDNGFLRFFLIDSYGFIVKNYLESRQTEDQLNLQYLIQIFFPV